MKRIRIFCEGTSDQRFLRDFISINYKIEITDNELKSNIFIHNLGGWSKLRNLKKRITEELVDYKTLIFLDADDKKTADKAGLLATRTFVEQLMEEWEYDNYDLFVFPNNENETGEVEDFFQEIINPENKEIFECWTTFENCLRQKNPAFTIPAKKSKIYVYHEALYGDTNAEKDKCKDAGRDFTDSRLWITNANENNYLKSVKDFLDSYLL